MLLREELIKERSRPWASPMQMVSKKDRLQLCVDYRKLHAVTRPDAFPMPRVEDLLDRRPVGGGGIAHINN